MTHFHVTDDFKMENTYIHVITIRISQRAIMYEKNCDVIYQQLQIFEGLTTECVILKLDTLWKQS